MEMAEADQANSVFASVEGRSLAVLSVMASSAARLQARAVEAGLQTNSQVATWSCTRQNSIFKIN